MKIKLGNGWEIKPWFRTRMGIAIAFMAICSAGSLCGQQAAAPVMDITGKWAGSIQRPFGELPFFFEFQMEKDGALHGVQHANSGDIDISQGRLDGAHISFVEKHGGFGNSDVMFTGEIVDGAIRLTQHRLPNTGTSSGSPVASTPGTSPQSAGTPKPGTPSAAAGGFNLTPVLLHRGNPASSYRTSTFSFINYNNLAKPELPEITELPYNGLAKTPPMGWNSWNKFNTHIDDKTVRQIADAIATNGMKDAGYTYIVIDDGWAWKRDSNGNILPNPNFPNMKALAEYVHSKGLKIGIYSSPGPRTCGGYEGSYGHEEQDASAYAAWGIDYLKYDWCSGSRAYSESQMRAAYQKMGAALEKSGRPIVFALCQYGRDHVEQWGPAVGGNLWRTTGDIRDTYESMSKNGFSQDALASYAGPGHWNDPDMLEVGNGGMSRDEYETHFSLWSILAAPLLAGNDVRDLTPEIREILLNKEVIAVDQDALGKQGTRVAQSGDTEVWAKPLQDGSYAVGLFNRSEKEQTVSVAWTDIRLGGPQLVRDLWAHKDIGKLEHGFSPIVPAHGVVMVKVSK